MGIDERLAVLIDADPRADASVVASRVLETAATLEELRALVFPQIRAAAQEEQRRRAKHKAYLKAQARAQANVRPCLWYPDPDNPAVMIVVPEDQATPAERLAAAEHDRRRAATEPPTATPG